MPRTGPAAAPDRVFPDYAGAFIFLLREWNTKGRLGASGLLLEVAPAWLGNAAMTFLVEQVRSDYAPGKGSPAAVALTASGGARAARTLASAGEQLLWGRFVLAAVAYLQAAVALYRRLDSAPAAELARALNHLRLLLAHGRASPPGRGDLPPGCGGLGVAARGGRGGASHKRC